MPSKPGRARGRGERRLEDALADLTSALTGAAVPWMVIGGIALIARGVRRMTTDIDVVVRGDAIEPATLVRALARAGIVPRIAHAAAFARESLVLLARHARTGVELDIAFAWTAFEHEALARPTLAAYGSITAPMASAEDLVVFKAMAARPKDIDDATALLLMYPDIDIARVRRRVAELGELADDPAILRGLDAILATASRHAALVHATSSPGDRSARVTVRPPTAAKTQRATPRTTARRKPRPR